MQAKRRKEVKRPFVDPLKNRNIGRRTGVDVKAGKVIRKDDHGFEVFDDYWTESENESVCVSPSKRGNVASFTNHPLSSNRNHVQPVIKSMSPFVPSSTENSGAVSSLNRKHANQGSTNGAPLNYDGELLGTITRVDNADSAEALENQAKPCSALLNFRMKKRLRYSEAPRKSGETVSGPDQLFAVPQQPQRPRQSIAVQGTSPDPEVLPAGTVSGKEDPDSCSAPSSQESAVSQGSSDANLEADAREPNKADDSRKVTLRRSSRMSKSRSESPLTHIDADSSRKRQRRCSRTESNSRVTMSPVNRSAGMTTTLDLSRRTRSGRLMQSPTDESNVSPQPTRRRSCRAPTSQRRPSETVVSSESQRQVAGSDVRSSSSQGSEVSACDTERSGDEAGREADFTEDGRGGTGRSRGVSGHSPKNARHCGDDTENSRGGRGRSRDDTGDSRGGRGRSRDDTGDSRGGRGRSRDDTENSRGGRGRSRDDTGDSRGGRGRSRDDTGDSRGGRGRSRDDTGDSRGGRGRSRDDTGDSRGGRGRSRDDTGDSRGGRGRSRDDTGDSDITHDGGDARHNTVDADDNVGDNEDDFGVTEGNEGSVCSTRHSQGVTSHRTSDSEDYEGDTRRSGCDAIHTAGDIEDNSRDTEDYEDDTRRSGCDAIHTTGDTEDNSRDTEDSRRKTEDSSRDTRHSGGDTRHSGSDTRHSGSDTRHSGSDTRHSGSDTRHSGGDTRLSASDEDNSSETVQHAMDAENIMGVASLHNVSVDDELKGGASSEVSMDTVDFLPDSSSQSEKSSVRQVKMSVGDSVQQMGDDTTHSDTDTDEQSLDDGDVVVDDNVKCSTDDLKTSQSSTGIDDDGSSSTGATGAVGKEPGVIRTDAGSDRRTTSTLSINADCSDDELRDESAGVVSHPQAASADRVTETRVAPDDVTCASDGEMSDDFEVGEPCFRVFGVQKRNSSSNRSAEAKSDLEGDSPALKDTTEVKSIGRKRARKTTGRKTPKRVKSVAQSPGVIGREASLQEMAEQDVTGRRAQNVKECGSSTVTPVVPSQHQSGSMRRRINLSLTVQSPNVSVRSSPVVASSLLLGSPVSAGDLRETPQDEASRHEPTSSGDESLPHPHPEVKLAKRKSPSPTGLGSISDGENEGDDSGKRKTATPRTRKGYSGEQRKRRASKSPKRGRQGSSELLSDDEEELGPEIGSESPRLALSFNEESRADTLLSGSSPSAVCNPLDISGRMPSPILAVTPVEAKGKVARRRRTSSSSPWLKPSGKRRKSPSLLRKALMPGRAAVKRRKSVFALTPVVMPSQQHGPPNTPSTGLKSILKKRFSTGTPVHYFETTQSAVTPLVTSQPTKNVKIIVPDDTEDAGIRRSKRTRVLPLDWFRNERILYERRKSGGFTVAGIVSPVLDEKKPRKRTKKRSPNKRSQSPSRQPIPETPRDMSLHRPLPDMCELVASTEISVVNPDTEEEVYVECVKSKDAFNFCGPSGKPATDTDPLILCKALNQKAFSIGQLVLRPLQEKGTHYVRLDTMVFVIKQGKLAVTIHKTTSVLETGDVFFVPQGNTYNLTNLRNEEAKVWFFQLKQ